MAITTQLSGAYVDKVGWIQPTEPVGSDVVADRCWVDTSSVPYRMYIRNATNTAWIGVGLFTGDVQAVFEVEGEQVVLYVSKDAGVTWKEMSRV